MSSGAFTGGGALRPSGPGGPGGGGNASFGALIKQQGENNEGLYISTPEADVSWHLRGVERQLEEAAVPADVTWENQDQDATVTLKVPVDWVVKPESVNTSRVRYQRLTAPRDAVAAHYDVGTVRAFSEQAGILGNNDRARVIAGTGARTKQNAHATVHGTRGVTTNDGQLLVRSPNFGAAVKATGLFLQVAGAGAGLTVTYATAGQVGNGFRIRVEYISSVSTGTAAPTVDRDDDNNVIGITVGVNGLTRLTAIGTALAGVSVGGQQLVEYSAGSGTRTFTQQSHGGENASVLTLQGGRDSGGDLSNTATARRQPEVKLNIAPTGSTARFIIVRGVTYSGPGVGLSGATISATRNSATGIVVSMTARAGNTPPHISIAIRGTHTIQAIVNALNAFTSEADGEHFIASNEDNDATLQITWSSTAAGGPASRFASGRTGGGVFVLRAAGAPAVSAKSAITVLDASNSNAEIAGGLMITHPTPGTDGNDWKVRFVRGTLGTQAFNDWQGVRVRAVDRGTGGNSLRVQYLGTVSNAVGTFTIAELSANITITMNPAATTVGAVVDAINGANPTKYRAEVAPGAARGDTFNPPADAASELRSLSGGDATTRSGNMSMVYSNANKRITIRHYIPDLDQVGELVTVITRNSRFQTGDGTNPGDVVVASAVTSVSDFIKVSDSGGSNTDYSFAGGLAPGRRPGVRPSVTVNYFDATGNAGVLELYGADTYTDFSQNIFVDSTTVGDDNNVAVTTGGTGTNVSIKGTVTLNDIIAAFASEFKVAGQAIRARLPAGADGTATVTWTSANNRRGSNQSFTGGVDPTDTLTASYVAGENILLLSAHENDTFDDMMDTIAALPEFQRSRGGSPVDGSMPGDLWLSSTGTTLDLVTVPDAVDDPALRYDWGGGHDARDRSPLFVTDGEEQAPVPATGAAFAGATFDYYKTGTEGNGFRIDYQTEYAPDLALTRASGTVTLAGKTLTARWHNNDAYGNGWVFRLRRLSTGTGDPGTQVSSGDKRVTLSLPDKTYTFRELINIMARQLAVNPQTGSGIISGIVTGSVPDADLDSQFTVNSSFATLDTTAFSGAGNAHGQVVAEYQSARRLRVTYQSTTRGMLTGVPFNPLSTLVAAVNAARWQGLQLIEASSGDSGAGPVTLLPEDAEPGDTVTVGSPTTLAGGAEGFRTLAVDGLLETDTEEDLHDAYASFGGTFFRFEGATTKAVGSFTDTGYFPLPPFTGGLDALGRQGAVVSLADRDGSINVAAILHPDEPQNTTIAELTDALWRATYTDDNGATVPVPFGNVIVDTSGGGSVDDPVRYRQRPTRPMGGENFVPEGPIEALVRPDDEAQGPNVEVRYHADEDTLQEILDALLAQDEVDIVEVYGTDLAAVPEEPPFVRAMYPGGGETTVSVTGGSNVEILDEGSSLGVAQSLDFQGPGVTVRGSGVAKVVAIGEGTVTERTLEQKVEEDVKPWALSGGPQVPDNEIPDAVARDVEVPGLLSGALTDGTPDTANYDDELPFLDSAGIWLKATSATMRALFKPSLPEWGNIPALFVFRVGDIVPHTGGLYYCTAQHTRPNNGPDTDDAHWLPLRWWWGDWTARYYPPSSTVTHNGGLYFAEEDVFSSDPSPDNTANTKWKRMDRGAGLNDGGEWSATGTWTPRELVRHTQPSPAMYITLQAVPQGIEPGVTNGWATYYVRIGWIDGAPSSLVGAPVVTGSTLKVTERSGREHQVTLPSGQTTVEANPAGSDGAVLDRIAIGGTNFVVNPEIAVGRAQIAGRVTTTIGKFPADLADHTDPIRVPAPARYTETWGTAWASRDWPVVPLIALAEDGGIASSLDTTENSVVLAEGNYIIGSLVQNIWLDNTHPGNAWNGTVNNNQRLSVEMLVERYEANSKPAVCRVTPQPSGDNASYWYVTMEGGADGPAGNDWKVKVQYDSTVSANSYSVVADTTEKEIILSVNGGLGVSKFPDIIADLNGELNLADGSASGITVSCIASGATEAATELGIVWGVSDTTQEYPFLGGDDWVTLTETIGSYTRATPFARQTTTSSGSTSTGDPGSDENNDGTGDADYDGRKSPIETALYSVTTIPAGGARVRFRMERGRTFDAPVGAGVNGVGGGVAQRYDAFGYPLGLGASSQGTTPWAYFCDVPGVSIYPLGRPVQTDPITPTPHITSFDSISGNLTPAAGSIADAVYGYSYTIAQGSDVGAARIIGFKGKTQPSGAATVLATLMDFDHGAGSVDIPSDVTLAADEEYRLRLQVFAKGVTPGPGTDAIGYHDIVIRAHAATTAAYHVGYVAYDSNDADAAATAARITDFTNDTATSPTLPSRLTIALPADTNEYQIYLLAKSDEAQPAGFTSAGQNASGSFYGAEDVTISSVTYKAYILQPLFRLTSANNGQYYGVTS